MVMLYSGEHSDGIMNETEPDGNDLFQGNIINIISDEGVYWVLFKCHRQY